jgi:hypothetical protein
MIVLAFHSADHSDVAAIAKAASDASPRAQIICRSGDAFDACIERSVGNRPVSAIHAPKHPNIVEAYAAAGIPALDIPAPQQEPAKPEGETPPPAVPAIPDDSELMTQADPALADTPADETPANAPTPKKTRKA